MSKKAVYPINNKAFTIYLELVKTEPVGPDFQTNSLLSNYICFKPVYQMIREMEGRKYVFQDIKPVAPPDEIVKLSNTITYVLALTFIPPLGAGYLYGAIKVKQIDLDAVTTRALK